MVERETNIAEGCTSGAYEKIFQDQSANHWAGWHFFLLKSRYPMKVIQDGVTNA